jgi:hypothetical protein
MFHRTGRTRGIGAAAVAEVAATVEMRVIGDLAKRGIAVGRALGDAKGSAASVNTSPAAFDDNAYGRFLMAAR